MLNYQAKCFRLSFATSKIILTTLKVLDIQIISKKEAITWSTTDRVQKISILNLSKLPYKRIFSFLLN